MIASDYKVEPKFWDSLHFSSRYLRGQRSTSTFSALGNLRMKILFVLACLVLSGSAQYSRFFPYWVEKELNLPTDAIGTGNEGQIMQQSKNLGNHGTMGGGDGELNKAVAEILSLRSTNTNRQRYLVLNAFVIISKFWCCAPLIIRSFDIALL